MGKWSTGKPLKSQRSPGHHFRLAPPPGQSPLLYEVVPSLNLNFPSHQVVALSKDKTKSVIKEEAIKVAEKAAAAVSACPLGEDLHENEGLMPPHRQEGLLADVSGLKMETMVLADAVYNKELSWLAFNWRVLYMAVMPSTPIFEVRKGGKPEVDKSVYGNCVWATGGVRKRADGGPEARCLPLQEKPICMQRMRGPWPKAQLRLFSQTCLVIVLAKRIARRMRRDDVSLGQLLSKVVCFVP